MASGAQRFGRCARDDGEVDLNAELGRPAFAGGGPSSSSSAPAPARRSVGFWEWLNRDWDTEAARRRASAPAAPAVRPPAPPQRQAARGQAPRGWAWPGGGGRQACGRPGQAARVPAGVARETPRDPSLELGLPEAPTLLRVAAFGPDPAAHSFAAGEGGRDELYEAVLEVGFELKRAGPGGIRPRQEASHFALAVSQVLPPGPGDGDREEVLRRVWQGDMEVSSLAVCFVPGLEPDSLYEFEAHAITSRGSSLGIQVRAYTPERCVVEADLSLHGLHGLGEDCAEEWEATEALEREWERLALHAAGGASRPGSRPASRPGSRHASRAGSPARAAACAGAEEQGCFQAVGLLVPRAQLPRGCRQEALQEATEAVRAACADTAPIGPQGALRLALGSDLKVADAVVKWLQAIQWRESNDMDAVRDRVAGVCRRGGSSPAALFPHHDEVYQKLIKVSPCALKTERGAPVSVWRMQSANDSRAASVPDQKVREWSGSVFEYLDWWVHEESQHRGRLVGYVEVYDFKGVSLRQVMSGDLRAKVEPVLRPKSYYAGVCQRVYIINASTMFNACWPLFRSFLSPGAEGIIEIDSGIPDALLGELGGGDEAKRRLEAVLNSAAPTAVLRPGNLG